MLFYCCSVPTGKRPQLMGNTYRQPGKDDKESYNYDNMLADILNSIIPRQPQRLKDEAKRQGYFSITHTLHEIIMQRTEDIKADTISAEVREMFTDVRIPTGQQINDDILYSRKKNVGGDYYQRQHKPILSVLTCNISLNNTGISKSYCNFATAMCYSQLYIFWFRVLM